MAVPLIEVTGDARERGRQHGDGPPRAPRSAAVYELKFIDDGRLARGLKAIDEAA